MNANDARISKLSVTKTGGDIQDATPNAPDTGTGSPAQDFDLVLEMEAGSNVGGKYDLLVTAYDVTAGANNAPMAPPAGPLNGPGDFATAPWVSGGATGDFTFDQTATIKVPAGVQRHVFYYTVALVSRNFQIVDIEQSAPFILV